MILSWLVCLLHLRSECSGCSERPSLREFSLQVQPHKIPFSLRPMAEGLNSPRNLLVLDFDQTLIPVDSDRWVVEGLAGEQWPSMKERLTEAAGARQWTRAMDDAMEQLHANGITQQKIIGASAPPLCSPSHWRAELAFPPRLKVAWCFRPWFLISHSSSFRRHPNLGVEKCTHKSAPQSGPPWAHLYTPYGTHP